MIVCVCARVRRCVFVIACVCTRVVCACLCALLCVRVRVLCVRVCAQTVDMFDQVLHKRS